MYSLVKTVIVANVAGATVASRVTTGCVSIYVLAGDASWLALIPHVSFSGLSGPRYVFHGQLGLDWFGIRGFCRVTNSGLLPALTNHTNHGPTSPITCASILDG